MLNRRLIVAADDLGLTFSFNAGILEAATQGFLTSTCVRVNGPAFEDAVYNIIPQCPNLGVGLHLNLVEGKTTRKNISIRSPLYDADGSYRLRFGGLYLGRKNKALLQAIELDYRDQIERSLKLLPIDHLNSHQHSHAIPEIFEIVCRLAKEYGIRYVRLPQERFHYAAPFSRHTSFWYGLNLLKFGVLNYLARKNARIAQSYDVLTNDWFVGVSYTGHMDEKTFLAGIKGQSQVSDVGEILLHPTKLAAHKNEKYLSADVGDFVLHPSRTRELLTLKNKILLKQIQGLGFNLTNFRKLAAEEVARSRINLEKIEVNSFESGLSL